VILDETNCHIRTTDERWEQEFANSTQIALKAPFNRNIIFSFIAGVMTHKCPTIATTRLKENYFLFDRCFFA
jgi:hypothetical protein